MTCCCEVREENEELHEEVQGLRERLGQASRDHLSLQVILANAKHALREAEKDRERALVQSDLLAERVVSPHFMVALCREVRRTNEELVEAVTGFIDKVEAKLGVEATKALTSDIRQLISGPMRRAEVAGTKFATEVARAKVSAPTTDEKGGPDEQR